MEMAAEVEQEESMEVDVDSKEPQRCVSIGNNHIFFFFFGYSVFQFLDSLFESLLVLLSFHYSYCPLTLLFFIC